MSEFRPLKLLRKTNTDMLVGAPIAGEIFCLSGVLLSCIFLIVYTFKTPTDLKFWNAPFFYLFRCFGWIGLLGIITYERKVYLFNLLRNEFFIYRKKWWKLEQQIIPFEDMSEFLIRTDRVGSFYNGVYYSRKRSILYLNFRNQEDEYEELEMGEVGLRNEKLIDALQCFKRVRYLYCC